MLFYMPLMNWLKRQVLPIIVVIVEDGLSPGEVIKFDTLKGSHDAYPVITSFFCNREEQERKEKRAEANKHMAVMRP